MTALVVGLGLAILAAGTVVVSARDGRAARIGLVLLLALAPALGSPLPTPAAFGARGTAGLLAVLLLGSAGRAAGPGSRLGWPSDALLGLAGSVVGLAVAVGLADLGGGPAAAPGDLLARLTPDAVALGAGVGLLSLGLRPIFADGDPARTTFGLLVAAHGLVLTRTGLAGAPGDVEHLAIAALVLAIATAGAVVAAGAAAAGAAGGGAAAGRARVGS
jgi:hypothetical protein